MTTPADGSRVVPQAVVGRVSLARAFMGYQLMVGVGFRGGTFGMSLQPEDQQRERQDLFSITGSALEAGAIWRPRDLDLRAGMAAALPVSSEEVGSEECDPLDCEGFILPDRVIEEMLQRLGARLRTVTEPFDPEAGAYAGHQSGGDGHHHHHRHDHG